MGNTFLLDHLLTLQPVKVLEGALLHDLLTIFVTEKLSAYMKFYEEKKDFVEGLGLKHERNVRKMRIFHAAGRERHRTQLRNVANSVATDGSRGGRVRHCGPQDKVGASPYGSTQQEGPGVFHHAPDFRQTALATIA